MGVRRCTGIFVGLPIPARGIPLYMPASCFSYLYLIESGGENEV